MQIAYSAHAENQLEIREISKTLVRQTIIKADKAHERSDGTVIAQKQVRWHNRDVLCRVVYRLTSRDRALIITAYITTKFSKYHEHPLRS